MVIEISQLVKEFDDGKVRAVDNLDLSLESGKLVTLLGPSGCGKTTTLRSVAGLEVPTFGTIEIDGKLVFSSDERILVPPHRRDVGMVFQSYAIWPHMTVAENVGYPLRNRGIRGAEAKSQIHEVLELVGLEQLADRPAPNLSGGQQQRVALARALVTEPKVLLLDEPLSNLDATLRESMRQEIREIQQRLGITTLYVTHDQSEALAISDTVAVMCDGIIRDIGEPERLYGWPRDRFVAEFIGLANILDVDPTNRTVDGDLWKVTVDGLGQIDIAAPPSDHGVGIRDDDLAIFIRLEDVHLQESGLEGRHHNTWEGTLVSKLFLGTTFDCVVEIDGVRLRAFESRTTMKWEVGDRVGIGFSLDACLPISSRGLHDGETGSDGASLNKDLSVSTSGP